MKCRACGVATGSARFPAEHLGRATQESKPRRACHNQIARCQIRAWYSFKTILQRSSPDIEVRACKYDGSLHRTWCARLIHQEKSLLILDAEFDVDIEHNLLGTIVAGTSSLEYYWLDRWYNVFRFGLPGGELRCYYCNVNVPPTFDGQVLSYIDLDIDILVQPNLTYQILDMDEFEKNSALYNYSNEVRRNSRQAVVELVRLIEMKQFPFST